MVAEHKHTRSKWRGTRWRMAGNFVCGPMRTSLTVHSISASICVVLLGAKSRGCQVRDSWKAANHLNNSTVDAQHTWTIVAAVLRYYC